MADSYRSYDHRHTGHTLSTQSGAILKDTVVPAGQPSEKAALLYQHSTLERQREVAEDADTRVQADREKASAEEDIEGWGT